MHLYDKARSYLINGTHKILGLNILKQEAMLRLALKEEGFSLRKLNIKIDHINGVNFVNGIELPIIYPKSFFDKAKALSASEKKTTFYFNGNMSDAGGRKEMLLPFFDKDSRLIESNYGRSALTKNKFNTIYYSELAASKFGLCPHQKNFVGNPETMWTYRFIECCMVHTIPVVFEEAPLGNKFVNKFFYKSDKEVLKFDIAYEKSQAIRNCDLCIERFTLSDKDIDKISTAK